MLLSLCQYANATAGRNHDSRRVSAAGGQPCLNVRSRETKKKYVPLHFKSEGGRIAKGFFSFLREITDAEWAVTNVPPLRQSSKSRKDVKIRPKGKIVDLFSLFWADNFWGNACVTHVKKGNGFITEEGDRRRERDTHFLHSR